MKNMHNMRFTKTVLKNLFSAPATRPYPETPREYPARTRGHVEIDIDTCILCGLCSRKCPTGAITVDRAGKTWTIGRFGCIQCGCCVETCPKKCLSMKQTYTQPGGEKTEDTFVKTNMPEPVKKPVPPAGAAAAAAKAAAGAVQAAAKPVQSVGAEAQTSAKPGQSAGAEAQTSAKSGQSAGAEAQAAKPVQSAGAEAQAAAKPEQSAGAEAQPVEQKQS